MAKTVGKRKEVAILGFNFMIMFCVEVNKETVWDDFGSTSSSWRQPSDKLDPSTSGDETDDEQNQENHEENPSDVRGSTHDSAEAECSSDECND